MTDVLDRANHSTCPFPTDEPAWTVVDDDVVVVGGRVPDLATHLEHHARASEIVGEGRVLSAMEIDPSVARSAGALVVIDTLTFENGTDRLTRRSRDAVLALAAHAPGYVEVLAWVVAPDDGRRTALEAAELSRRRVSAIHRIVEEGTELVVFVRVEQRDADLTAARGPRTSPRRRYALRIRPV